MFLADIGNDGEIICGVFGWGFFYFISFVYTRFAVIYFQDMYLLLAGFSGGV